MRAGGFKIQDCRGRNGELYLGRGFLPLKIQKQEAVREGMYLRWGFMPPKIQKQEAARAEMYLRWGFPPVKIHIPKSGPQKKYLEQQITLSKILFLQIPAKAVRQTGCPQLKCSPRLGPHKPNPASPGGFTSQTPQARFAGPLTPWDTSIPRMPGAHPSLPSSGWNLPVAWTRTRCGLPPASVCTPEAGTRSR